MLLVDGLLHFTVLQDVIAVLVMTHITIASVTIYLHRHQAHRALDLHPAIAHCFRLWLWLSTGMQTKAWTAIHRKHHAKCETEADPHSPQILGLKKVLWQGAELYREEGRKPETLARYGQGTPDDWLEKHIYTPYSAKGILLLLVIELILFGLPAITMWAIQMMWIPFFAAGVINGVAHYMGYRHYESEDASMNLVPWGILIGGEELHNNHHAFPSSAKLSSQWYEFDIGWCYISILRLLGLATVKRLPPEVMHDPLKTKVDFETVKAIIATRFQLLSHYSKTVILPILREEMEHCYHSGLSFISWRRAKHLLTGEVSLLKEKDQQQLALLLTARERLAVVYQLRLKLQSIWQSTHLSPKELVILLEEWCLQAENASLPSLKAFANYLHCYAYKSSAAI